MSDEKIGHVKKLALGVINEKVNAEPRVSYTNEEIELVLKDLYIAVDNDRYISPTATVGNPPLSDDYIFDSNDEKLVLKDLKLDRFVGKIVDLSKGAKKRKQNGYPDEYLYVFNYPCTLARRDADISGMAEENVLIYIKINDRKIPYKKVFVISFHKNNPRVT